MIAASQSVPCATSEKVSARSGGRPQAPQLARTISMVSATSWTVVFHKSDPNSAARSLFTVGVLLAIMILPIITNVSREVFRQVPRMHEEAALALGATRWEVIRMSVLPFGRSGVISASMLGLGRALGETMAVTMVIGNRHELSASLFAPGYTMASLIANEFSEATSDLHLSALMAVGFVLFLITLIVNGVARWLVWRTGGRRA